MINHVLTVDVGTQSLKACVVDHNLVVQERTQVFYEPLVKSKNRVEIDAEILWNAFIKACRRLKLGNRIDVISLATLCPSLVPMDACGRPLYPVILHLDRRSYRQAVWALEQVGEEKFLQTAGNLPIPGGISVTSLLWLKEYEPAIYHRKDVVFGHVVTLFMKRLAGCFVIDPSNASFMGIYDTVGCSGWHDGLLKSLQIEKEKLPQVVNSMSVVGDLNMQVAKAAGLSKNIPVVIGANDTTCAAAGAGVCEPGDLMNTTGTVDSMVLSTDRPLVSKNHLLRTHAYPNRWLAMRTVGAGGASVEWFRRTFCKEMTKKEYYDKYLADVLSTSRKPDARFLPYLSGDRHRIRPKSGSFTRLSLHTTREDFLLALVHGIISFQVDGLREWEKQVPLSRTIYHVGGGASKAYTNYKQAMLKNYKFVQLGETAVIGAAKLAIEALEA